MSDVTELSALLGTVYDASLDATLWPSAIERAYGFLKCMGGMIGAYDLLQKNTNVRALWGYEPEFMETFDYYVSINPLLRHSFRMKVGEIGSITDAMTHAEFRANRVYLEWAKPQGIVDVIQTTLEKAPLALAVLGLSRHKRRGLVDERLRQRMALITPHFRRAVLIGKVIDLARIEAAAFSDAIDGLAAAVFLVDASGRLLHANTSGEAMLVARDPFSTIEGILTATNQKIHRSLSDSFAVAAGGDAAVEKRGIAVPLTAENGERFAAHVLPMTSGRRRDAEAAHATAALFVRKVDLEFPAVIRSMAAIYRLTPSEVRVLHVILQVGGVSPTSLMLRLGENTVKTHLRHIFQKTGARNQVDLVKLVAGLSSPLAQSAPTTKSA
jgi:DNA-binding CsgD family transcriptional regulator